MPSMPPIRNRRGTYTFGVRLRVASKLLVANLTVVSGIAS
jgi:hypothetical protein